jgi:glycosyltransferase involved in cell wall biosynthesis
MIPTYNQSHFVGDAVESVLKQSYTNLEIVVLDDNSSDNTSEVIGTYNDPRVRYIKNESNLGRVKNYRQGLNENTNGKWVLNLDGDDYLTDFNYIEDCINILNSNPNALLIFGGYSKKENDSKRSTKYTKYTGKDFLIKGYRPWLFNHLTSIYNREIALEVGFYTQDILSSDAESILRLCSKGDIIYKEGIGGYWRPHGDNFTSKSKISSKILNFITLSDSFTDFYTKNPDTLSSEQIEKWNKRMSVAYFTPLLYSAMKIFSFKEIAKVLSAYRKYIGLEAVYLIPIFLAKRFFDRNQ